MSTTRYPALYQVNIRVWLTELSRTLGRRATLIDVPDSALDDFARQGFDWIWLLSVWQTGAAGRAVARASPELRRAFAQTLPDLGDDDIAGSGFAITGYSVHRDLGGDAALAHFRDRLRQRGLRLMLDFVPNHVARDHPWVQSHPEYLVAGTERDIARAPQDYFRASTAKGPRVLAHGRDPYFPGWSDTIQLDYGNPALQEAMIGELTRIAGQCDGVRCDMAMLVLPEVFQRTWGIGAQPFWPRAIARVREQAPGFVLMAEVYWDLERTLQREGFDYCYDKQLYDRLRDGRAGPVHEHLLACSDYHDHLARFLENHDEARAAAAFDPARHRAAAVLTFLSPGLRFFHQGQLEGHRIHISPHLVRGPREAGDPELSAFYARLLALLQRPALRHGDWRLLKCGPAWEGNWTHADFIAFAWEAPAAERLLVVVNYSGHQGQARVQFPDAAADTGHWRLQDLLDGNVYDRAVPELRAQGLYVDLPAWGCHVFTICEAGS